VTQKFPLGSKVQGKVASLTDYGAFIELEEGIEGLVHVSEMSWTKRLKSPAEVVSTGDLVEVVVLDVQPAERRMALGMRQAIPDPWMGLRERCSVGQVVHGRVANLTDFGAFIEIEEGIEGLIHVSDFNSFRKVKHPSEVLKKGETIKVVIVHIDAENHRLSLSYLPPQEGQGSALAAKAGVQGPLLSFEEKGSFRDVKKEENH
jgi:small subunit ribosomal protein S1